VTSTRKTGLEPAQVLRLATGALTGRISIPLSLLRERAAQMSGKATIALEPASPGLRIRGEAHALGAPISFAARVDADGVHVEGEQRTIRITLSEVELSTTDDAPGPLADAIRDGMIDTENPATLVGNMMSLPDFIIEAEGRTVVIDLMRVPALAKDDMMRAAVAAATSYLCIKDIRVSESSIDLQLGLLPGGPREAALSTARAALTPAVRYLWSSGGRRP
jgi:hypothetical protein